jgi:hypothetical protein
MTSHAQTTKAAGDVVSRLLREALALKSPVREYRSGVPLLPRRTHNVTVTTEMLNLLRDDD